MVNLWIVKKWWMCCFVQATFKIQRHSVYHDIKQRNPHIREAEVIMWLSKQLLTFFCQKTDQGIKSATFHIILSTTTTLDTYTYTYNQGSIIIHPNSNLQLQRNSYVNFIALFTLSCVIFGSESSFLIYMFFSSYSAFVLLILSLPASFPLLAQIPLCRTPDSPLRPEAQAGTGSSSSQPLIRQVWDWAVEWQGIFWHIGQDK